MAVVICAISSWRAWKESVMKLMRTLNDEDVVGGFEPPPPLPSHI